MRFELSNVGACRLADIEVSRIALLAGTSGQGKTSIVYGMRASATGQVIPTDEVKKSEAIRLVKRGAEKGFARFSGDGFEVTVGYPKAEAKGTGAAPHVSAFAAGIECITEVDLKKRAAILGPLLKIDPTREDVLKALREAKVHQPAKVPLPDDLVEDVKSLGLDPGIADDRGLYRWLVKLWVDITDKGWNTAHADAVDKGKIAKSDWKKATGHNGTYGPQIAESWRPTGWSDELSGSTVEALAETVTRAKEAKTAADRADAASGAIIAELRAKADKLPDLEKELTIAKRALDKARDADNVFTIKAPPIVPTKGMCCPHCNGAVSLVSDLAGQRLEKGSDVSQADIDAAKAARSTYDADKKAARDAFDAAYEAHGKLDMEVNLARAAKTRLDEAMKVAASSVDPATAKAALDKAESDLKAFTTYHEALKQHRAVQANGPIVELLSENGVRRAKLLERIEAFNKDVLAPLCKAARIPPITVNDDLQFEFNGSSTLLCAGERNKIRIIMQLAIAKLDGSALVIIDDFDRIPAEERGNFVRMIAGTGLHAVIAMMVPTPDKAPSLAAAKLGQTYWVEAGEVSPWGEAMDRMSKAA